MSRKNGEKISIELEDKICELYLSGLSANKVANTFDISSRSVLNIIHKKGIFSDKHTNHPLPKDIELKIKNLYEKGYGSHTIEKELKISKPRILKVIHKYKLLRNRYHSDKFYSDFWEENGRWYGNWKCQECNKDIKFSVNKKCLLYRNLKGKKICKKCSLIIQNKDGNNHSKAEYEIIDFIKSKNLDVITDHSIKNKIYDVYIPTLNLIIEYNGTYWHCDPRIYSENFKHKKKGITAKDIWKKDKEKLYLAVNGGYNYEVIWEMDYKRDNNILNKILQKWENKLTCDPKVNAKSL